MIWRFWNQVFGHWEHRQFICMFLLFLDWFYCIIIEFRPEKFHFDRKNPFFRVFFIIIVWVQLSSIWFSLFWLWIVINNKQLLRCFDNGCYTISNFFNNVASYHNYFLQKTSSIMMFANIKIEVVYMVFFILHLKGFIGAGLFICFFMDVLN